jgi:hypothetical protein
VPLSSEHREALRNAVRKPYELSPEVRNASAERMRKMSLGKVGPQHPRWIVDRTKTARKSQCRDCADVTWSSAVRRRFPKCVMSGRSYGECGGRLESHHIEPIVKSSEKRFDVDNGVTLCRCHHPRKQSEVVALAPLFRQIVAEGRKEL